MAIRKPISVNTVKIHNRLSVFRELLQATESTRIELATRCSISLGTVVTILEELAAEGVVVESADSRTTVGRKPNIVRIVGSAKRIVSIDLSSKNFVYEILDIDLADGSSGKHQFRAALSFEENLRRMLAAVRSHMQELDVSDADIIGVGVSVPGSYRFSSDTIENAPFPELQQVALKAVIQECFSQPVLIDHDVFLAARAEIRHIADYESKNVFYMFLGEGVGGALAARGEIYRGAREDAGDIGRIYITETETLEELVSWNQLVPLLYALDSSDSPNSPVELSRLLHDEKSPVSARVRETSAIVARALHDTFWVLDPDCFVIGGEYHRFGAPFLDLIRRHLHRYLGPAIMQTLEVKLAQYGSRGASLGAGEIVRDKWLSSL